MASIVIRPGQETKTVKNLGWIIKHAAEVNLLAWRTCPNPGKDNWRENTFTAYLKDGTIYQSDYADLDVCRDWLKRSRNFKGLTFDVDGTSEII